MIATYAAALAVCAASLAFGQAAIALCGARRWSWLAPPVGLALLLATCWATVRMPGDGTIAAIAAFVLLVAAVAFLRGRAEGGKEALRAGLPVGVAALLAASLPFAAEGHFGILGTGFNPDMSQHLLATDALAHGGGSQLLHQGYPLGPHSVVVALDKGLGIGLVQGFDGFSVAVAILAPLTALAAFEGRPLAVRIPAALLVGLPYLVASYFAQGAFKEVTQALLVLAFLLSLRESTRTWRDLPLRFVPAAIVAIGSVYTYSFPGLTWLVGIAVLWLALEWASTRSNFAGRAAEHLGSETSVSPAGGVAAGDAAATGPAGLGPLLLALAVFLVGSLPELGRMIDFHQFETFDPTGPGLGNLFGQVSPFTALGIWPSGDFRLAPGDGAVPALAYYLVAAFAAVLLIIGIARAWRGRESAVLAGVTSASVLYLAARLGGTPYTAAKALEIAAPLLTLAILLPLTGRAGLRASPAGGVAAGVPHGGGDREAGSEHMGDAAATGPAVAALAVYLLAAGACSLLAFANAPVGPTSYSPALTGLRPVVAADSTLVLAPEKLLAEEQGERYIVWELRGGRVCVAPESTAGGEPPDGVRFVITANAHLHPPFRGFVLNRRAGPYLLWERRGPVGGRSDCPLIAVRQARAGAK